MLRVPDKWRTFYNVAGNDLESRTPHRRYRVGVSLSTLKLIGKGSGNGRSLAECHLRLGDSDPGILTPYLNLTNLGSQAKIKVCQRGLQLHSTWQLCTHYRHDPFYPLRAKTGCIWSTMFYMDEAQPHIDCWHSKDSPSHARMIQVSET